ncbi:MAG: ATP-binding protein [Chthoniobacteraceae bacterium]|nr:ATP-binding protein [Chthoniobacteraceae bacterium]
MKRPRKQNSPSRPKLSAGPRSDAPWLARLSHLQKLRLFGEFAGGVAHDFNNLLTVFHGYTELMQMTIACDDPRQEYLSEMARAVERARALTTALLDFNRKKPDTPLPLSLGTLLLGFRRMLRRIANEKIEFSVHAEEGAGWTLAAPGPIESILINLAANACEAMPQGGRLCLDLEEITLRPSDRRARAGWAPGPYVRISVRDTGAGIAKSDRPRIFEPGFTTHPEREAPGMGLTLCAAIAEANGGRLTARSIPGKGSEFQLFLPRIPAPAREEAPAAARKAPAAFGKGKKVLVAEDDDAARKTLAAMLRQLGFQPLCASNGEEALRLLEGEPETRLLITDLVMPLMGGAALAEAVRQRWPRIGILFTSGYAMEPPEPCISQGISPFFLAKPLAFGALARKLRELLDV